MGKEWHLRQEQVLEAVEFCQVIDHKGPGVFQGSLQIFNRFIDAMHENVFTWNPACYGDGDLAFPGAIHKEIMGLSPFGDGFAEKGFACIGYVRGRWIGSG